MDKVSIGAEAKLAGLHIDCNQKIRDRKLSLKEYDCFLNLNREQRLKILKPFTLDTRLNKNAGSRRRTRLVHGRKFRAKIVQIISEWKRPDFKHPPKKGYKRVEAIVEDEFGHKTTRHIDIPK